VGWPRDQLPFDILGELLKGAAEMAGQARCLVLGGHSIDAVEPTFGMAVVGEVHPDMMVTNAGACAGDLLLLTKPLGTGILATALKRDALLETGMTEAIRSMTTLNEGAARAALRVGVSAATDITGFGLIGHLTTMLEASKVAADLAFEAIPILPHARNLASRGIVPGGTERNLAAANRVEWADDLDLTDRYLCTDAQTSGGLLLAVPAENQSAILAALQEEATPAAAIIGRVRAGPPGAVRVVRRLENR
jgi:selenide, water dikinase